MFIAAILCAVLSPNFEIGLPLAPLGVQLGIGFAVFTALFAGLFPALSAARLTPIEEMRG